jgi:hypothetical protein
LHINKKNDVKPEEVKDLSKISEDSIDLVKRRSALAKIGKFSAYAIPTTIAIVTSTAAHASP